MYIYIYIYIDVPPLTFFSCERRREQVSKHYPHPPPPPPPPMQRPVLSSEVNIRRLRNCERHRKNCQHVPFRCRVMLKIRLTQLSSQYSAARMCSHTTHTHTHTRAHAHTHTHITTDTRTHTQTARTRAHTHHHRRAHTSPQPHSPRREICVSVYACVMVMQCLRCTQASLIKISHTVRES